MLDGHPKSKRPVKAAAAAQPAESLFGLLVRHPEHLGQRAFGDTSTLKMGPKAQFELHPESGGHLYSYFDFAPFYQTDFYGKEQAAGGTISWMPLNREFFLGGVPETFNPNDHIATGFLELVPEASDVSVKVAGQTNLTVHNYEWLGGAARLYLFPFLSTTAPDPTNFLNNRFALVGTVQSYWDANSGVQATLYSAILQYKLTCPAAGLACPYGAPSLSLEYDTGTDKDMLQTQKKLTLKLSYAY